MDKVKIGIVGMGFVGSAVKNAFVKADVYGVDIDPAKGQYTMEEMLSRKPQAVFICVPTPSLPSGHVDQSFLEAVLAQIPKEVLCIVKSTITPNWLQKMPNRIVYNPEFLTQRTAIEDFINCDSLIFGGKKEDCYLAEAIYREGSIVNPCPVFHTDIATASLVKYTLNCHFAAKVAFMNEIYRLHSKVAGSTWNEFKVILGADKRLGHTHLDVPGHDGYFGYGGACFPKDTRALLNYAHDQGVNLSILREVIASNERVRDE